VGEALITVDDAHGDLLPNTNVTVTVTVSQRFNVLSVPREALHTEGTSNFVFRVIDGKLVRTPVQIDVVTLTRVEITGGLTEKDTVALNATSNRDLSNGLAVKIVE
jgi:HlyD family secretion protein